AVLYFDDGSRDRRLGYLADGLTESLIEALESVPTLEVVSRNGVAPWRGTAVAPDSVGRALGVGTVVQGRVEERGGRVRVELNLLDGQSGARFDSKSLELPDGNPLAVRDSIARQAALLLRARLGDEIRLREQRASTRSPEAWALVQRAAVMAKEAEQRAATDRMGSAVAFFRQADSLLVRAESLDPRWAEPIVQRAALARRQERMENDPQRAAAWIETGIGHAQRALALDPRNADALETRGALTFARVENGLVPEQRDVYRVIADAERDLRAAVEIDPTQAEAWNVLSVLEYGKLNVMQANINARKAYEADAFQRAAPSVLWRLYVTSYDMEQFADASHWCEVGGRRFPQDPRFAQCQLWLMTSKYRSPDPAEAWRLLGELEKLTPKHLWEYQRREAEMAVGGVLGRAGLRDSADRVLRRARAGRDIDPRGELMGYEAFARTLMGEREEAISLLERYLTSHPEHRAGFAKANAWWWRDLQQDPRFQALAAAGR
ncbi:MAG TPA: hypothetical protein VFS44_05295, partial [Gemmatimonadaceae bacterium]|nr:hypothetical protein [Gemmatimonadaceae bacterium]